MKKETLDKFLKISEEFFGSQTDPDQMPINQESRDKLKSIDPDCLIYKVDENEEPIGWTVVVPTSADVMNKFVSGQITERQLLDIATAEKKFEALYLCAVFIVPKFRRQGYALKMVLDAISRLSKGKDLDLYCWIYSEEGRKLIQAISEKLEKNILNRKSD